MLGKRKKLFTLRVATTTFFSSLFRERKRERKREKERPPYWKEGVKMRGRREGGRKEEEEEEEEEEGLNNASP